MLRLYLYARVRVLCAQLHTRPRVQRAPGLPCALFLKGANEDANLGRNAPRDREGVLDERASAPHPQLSSSALCAIAHWGGRSSIPETAVIESIGRGVLDPPQEPVIGLAEGETRWRGTTSVGGARACHARKRSRPL